MTLARHDVSFKTSTEPLDSDDWMVNMEEELLWAEQMHKFQLRRDHFRLRWWCRLEQIISGCADGDAWSGEDIRSTCYKYTVSI